jgi:uncharacterized membrane protein YbhN (UPF0104 family)
MHTSPVQTLKRLAYLVPRLMSVVLFGVALWVIYQQLHQYSLKDVVQSVTAISVVQILAALALMGLNYGVITGYDTLAIHYIRQSLPYRKIALVAILSTVISNNIGFAVLANSLIRYRFYSRWGITTLQVAGISAFCNLSYGLGQMTVGGIVFLTEPLSIPTSLHLPFNSIHLLGAVCLAGVMVYIISSALSQKSLKLWKYRIPHLPLKITLVQIGISSLDWMLSAAIFYVLLPSSTLLSYPACLGMYLLAQFAGVISNVPGGLGIFETVMLLLLSPIFSPEKLIGALLAFRGIYNFLPFVFTMGVLGLYELRHKLLGKGRSSSRDL